MTEPPHREASSQGDFVSFGHKLAYGIGGAVDLLAVWVLLAVAYPVFQMRLGMAPTLLATALLMFRLWDAISDPIMGWITDNLPTRWGRRRPYMVMGAIGCGLLYPILWHFPTDASHAVILTWFVGFGILFYTSFTVWNIPYGSLFYEMTPDYHERTRIASYKNAFLQVALLVQAWMWSIILLLGDIDPVTGEADSVSGMRQLSIYLGIFFLVAGLIPAIFVRERKETQQEKAHREDHKVGASLPKEILLTFRNRYFIALAGMTLLLLLGPQMIGNFGLYVLRYYVVDGNETIAAKFAGYGGTIYTTLNILSIPFWAWLSRRIGKLGTVYVGLAMVAISSLMTLFIYVPGLPALSLLGNLVAGPGQSAIWLMLPSMTADLVDHDELVTGRRREGSYASVFPLLVKLGLTLAIFFQGPMLDISGFDVALEANQPESVFLKMRIMMALFPLVALFLGIFFLRAYTLTEKIVNETRETLEDRRGVLQEQN